jgi:pimeloyl-ACP methyl ester carboxylesterase
MAQRRGSLPPLQAARTRSGRLHYIVSGRGRPAIVLLNGAGMSLEGWHALYPAIERMATVFAWDRLGVKGSSLPRRAQTGAVVLQTLRELLDHAAVPPPYVLVGHSLGGLYANLYARLHPADVSGVLFLEATHPDDHAVLRKHETFLAQALAKVLSLPQAALRRGLHAEMERLTDTVREIEAAGPFPNIPVTVVTGGRAPPAWMMSPAAAGARRAHQQALARLSPLGEQLIAQHSGHFPQLSQPALVLDALAGLHSRCRREGALA